MQYAPEEIVKKTNKLELCIFFVGEGGRTTTSIEFFLVVVVRILRGNVFRQTEL